MVQGRRQLLGVLACVTLVVAVPAGCGDSQSTSSQDSRDSGALDPKPEKKDGSESQEFEQEDLDQAEDAGRLVEIYCSGAVSEAQYEGCLSHVTEDDVCTEDTSGKEEAVSEYRQETGNEAVCE